MKKLSLILFALAFAMFSCKPEVEKPTVVTESVGEVTTTTAQVVGQVTADGGAEVSERGVCWNTENNPEVIHNRLKDAQGGIGIFTSHLPNLAPNTQYYVRAYATNEKGTSYGEVKTFTTEKEAEPETPEIPNDTIPELPETPIDSIPETPVEPEEPEKPEVVSPVVKTKEVTEIMVSSAVCGGEVTFDGNCKVTARGVCWSTTQNPTIEDSKTADGTGLGSYTSRIQKLVPNTQYYVRAYATNEKGTAYGEEVSFTTLPSTGTANGYTWIDLGLPSGIKWATCNIGANSPEEYGNYYAWGETETKIEYTEDNSPTYALSIEDLKSQGYIDENGNLTPSHDAATANWGGDWRIPTYYEIDELVNNCNWTWTTENEVNGYKVTGPNGNSIFLPAAGYRLGSSLLYADSFGHYWISTANDGSNFSYYLVFYIDTHGMLSYRRNYGRPVRPVRE